MTIILAMLSGITSDRFLDFLGTSLDLLLSGLSFVLELREAIELVVGVFPKILASEPSPL